VKETVMTMRRCFSFEGYMDRVLRGLPSACGPHECLSLLLRATMKGGGDVAVSLAVPASLTASTRCKAVDPS
jgi:hypothetical protein